MMNKLFIFILLPLSALAQTKERQVIGSAGDYSSASNVQMSYTIGETMVETKTANTVTLTQGFQQAPGWVVGIDHIETGLSIKAYPNPVEGQMIIEFDVVRPMHVQIEIFDLVGRQYKLPLESLHLSAHTKQLFDLSKFPAGNYIMNFKTEGSVLGTIKVQKLY